MPLDTTRLRAQARSLAVSAGVPLPPVVAPAAKLATLPRPNSRQVQREEVPSSSASEQADEIRNLRHGAGSPAAATVPGEGQTEEARALAPPTRAASTPALAARTGPAPGANIAVTTPAASTLPAVPPQAAQDAGPALEVGLASQPSPAVPVPAPVPITVQAPVEIASTPAPRADSAVSPRVAARPGQPVQAPSDAVDVALALRPNPMSRGEQIDVLHAVAQLGIVMRDLRAQNAALRASVQAGTEKIDSAVADFERRLALAEARGALNAAMGADPGMVPVAPVTGGTAARTVRLAGGATVQQGMGQPGAAAPASAVNGPRRYKVQAASPGLAMLSELDRSGGEGSQLQVGVGDQVPGFGKVTAIQQRGSTWWVQTDRGAIQ